VLSRLFTAKPQGIADLEAQRRFLPGTASALKQCLDENAIAAVKVELDGQAYAMEGLSSGSR